MEDGGVGPEFEFGSFHLRIGDLCVCGGGLGCDWGGCWSCCRAAIRSATDPRLGVPRLSCLCAMMVGHVECYLAKSMIVHGRLSCLN